MVNVLVFYGKILHHQTFFKAFKEKKMSDTKIKSQKLRNTLHFYE